MKLKSKIISGGVVVVLVALLTGVLFQENFDAVQTSLVKNLDGENHQCVAYVERYYQDMFGIKISSVGMAMNLAQKASDYGLYFHENGGVVAPQPGDILVFGNKNKIGHVAIVTGTLNDGVLIVEQNWQKDKITNNNGKALEATYHDGKYTIKDRYYSKTSKDKYWVMGWVSRSSKNPVKFVEFTNENSGGWLPEHDVKKNKSKDKEAWSVKVSGKDPRVLSPIFLDRVGVDDNKQIVFKASVKNNKNASEGVLYIRDEKGEWSEQIPFPVEYPEDGYKIITVDLSRLRSDLRITQIKLKLANNNNRNKEIWKIDWLRIGEKHGDILESIQN